MSDERFQSTPEDILTGRAIPPELLQDLLQIAQINDSTCQAISQTLHSLPGMADTDAAEVAVKAAGVSDEVAESVVRALSALTKPKLKRFVDAVSEWVAGKSERSNVFTKVILSQLSRNLTILIDNYHAIDLMQKANQLLRDVGNEIENIKFVCDLRPVFDESRKNVEAFVLVATMRLIYQQQDGSRRTCEIVLSESEMKDLHDQSATAIKKMDVLNQLRSTLVIPRETETVT